MRAQRRLVAAFIAGASCLGAVSLASQQKASPASAGAVRVTTRLVLVDVVVTDKDGHPVTDRSDLGTAVTEAVVDGSQYYTLGFYPAAAGERSKHHKIEVRLARKGLEARYRRGYEIFDAAERTERTEDEQMQEMMAGLASSLPPTAIAFQSRVLPPEPGAPALVTAEFLVDAKSAEFTTSEDGRRMVSLDVLAAAVDADRNVVASAGQRLDFQFPADVFERVREQGLPYKLELSVPPGSYELKLLVRDNLSGHLGRIDITLEVLKPLESSP